MAEWEFGWECARPRIPPFPGGGFGIPASLLWVFAGSREGSQNSLYPGLCLGQRAIYVCLNRIKCGLLTPAKLAHNHVEIRNCFPIVGHILSESSELGLGPAIYVETDRPDPERPPAKAPQLLWNPCHSEFVHVRKEEKTIRDVAK